MTTEEIVLKQKEKFEEYCKLADEIEAKQKEIEKIQKEIAALRVQRENILCECYDEYEENLDENEDYAVEFCNTSDMGIYMSIMDAAGDDITRFKSLTEFFELFNDEEYMNWGAITLLKPYCAYDIESIELDYWRDNKVRCDCEAEGHGFYADIIYKDGEIIIDK